MVDCTLYCGENQSIEIIRGSLFTIFLLAANNSQPVSLYNISIFVNIGHPIAIRESSIWSCSNLLELSAPQLSHNSHEYSKSGLLCTT